MWIIMKTLDGLDLNYIFPDLQQKRFLKNCSGAAVQRSWCDYFVLIRPAATFPWFDAGLSEGASSEVANMWIIMKIL